MRHYFAFVIVGVSCMGCAPVVPPTDDAVAGLPREVTSNQRAPTSNVGSTRPVAESSATTEAVLPVKKTHPLVARRQIENMGLLMIELQRIPLDVKRKRALMSDGMRELGGRTFFEKAIEQNILGIDVLPLLVAEYSSDRAPLADEFAALPLLADVHCSYATPKAKDLLRALNSKGSNRCVVIAPNARNWRNFEDRGVPVFWSDDDSAVWLTADDARRQFGITQGEWNDPAGQVLGKKAPFQHLAE